MTPAEIRFFARAKSRLADMEPDMRVAVLRALQNVRDQMSEEQFARLIASGRIDQIIGTMLSDTQLDRAFLPVRQQIRRAVDRGFTFASRDLPNGGKIDGQIAVAFDHLSPDVISALTTLESQALSAMKADVRDVVSAYIENGIRDGRSPLSVAQDLRALIGLGPSQLEQVQNFRRALEDGDIGKALGYTLRDKRYDATVQRGDLSSDQIDRMVDAYTRRRVAQNAATNAKTITFDAYKQGQSLSWQQAKDVGVVPSGYVLMKRWQHLAGQADPRPEHIAMNGEEVPADQPYSNGDSYAGEQDPWNCHCLDMFFVQQAA